MLIFYTLLIVFGVVGTLIYLVVYLSESYFPYLKKTKKESNKCIEMDFEGLLEKIGERDVYRVDGYWWQRDYYFLKNPEDTKDKSIIASFFGKNGGAIVIDGDGIIMDPVEYWYYIRHFKKIEHQLPKVSEYDLR